MKEEALQLSGAGVYSQKPFLPAHFYKFMKMAEIRGKKQNNML